MDIRTELFPRGIVGLAALTVLLAACGGGGGGGDGGSSGGGGGGSASARLECKVTDAATGQAVAGATVNYQAQTTTFTTQTNANGNCLMEMPAAEVVGVQYPAGTVTKSGYEPQTILCESLRSGNTCYQEVTLIPLATNISIPVGGDTVMHLGDDDFEGSNNSQFQKPTDGAELVFPITDWAEQVKAAGVTRATVYLDAKGWQSNICRNEISIVGDAGTQTLPGGVSPVEGYWAGGRQVPFVFDIAQIGLQSASLKITSGVCSGTTDIDDFETNRIRVEFN